MTAPADLECSKSDPSIEPIQTASLSQKSACKCVATVLIVDDNVFNTYVLENLLLMSNLHVDKAMNGEEAVEMFIDNHQKHCCGNKYQLVMMDLEMPVMDGYLATQKIIEF